MAKRSYGVTSNFSVMPLFPHCVIDSDNNPLYLAHARAMTLCLQIFGISLTRGKRHLLFRKLFVYFLLSAATCDFLLLSQGDMGELMLLVIYSSCLDLVVIPIICIYRHCAGKFDHVTFPDLASLAIYFASNQPRQNCARSRNKNCRSAEQNQ